MMKSCHRCSGKFSTVLHINSRVSKNIFTYVIDFRTSKPDTCWVESSVTTWEANTSDKSTTYKSKIYTSVSKSVNGRQKSYEPTRENETI